MSNISPYVAFTSFRKFVERDDKYFEHGRTGVIEDVLSYFGLPTKRFVGAHSVVHEDHLETLRNFLCDCATQEQIDFVMKIAQGDNSLAGTLNNYSADTSNKVFVSMPMNRDKYDCVDVIRGGTEVALQKTGNIPYYLDLDIHNENISQKMIEEIRACKFLVADFTYQNSGVYYEVGYAKGIGKTVIHTCRKDELQNLHFDIKQTQFVVWDDINALSEKLVKQIVASGLGGSI